MTIDRSRKIKTVPKEPEVDATTLGEFLASPRMPSGY